MAGAPTSSARLCKFRRLPICDGEWESQLDIGKTQTTLTITSKAGQDIHGNYLGPFLDADNFISTHTPGPVNDTISATITIGDYSEAFTNIVITGTLTEVYKNGSDGSSYPLDAVKIKGKSQ